MKEYRTLPYKERYRLVGLIEWYKIPLSMETGEWGDFYSYVKKCHPIQFFFRDTIPSQWRRVSYRVKDLYWKVKWWVLGYNKVKFGPVNYYDSDSKIELCLEKIFMDFYNIEFLSGVVDWDYEYSKDTKAKILEIHHYFTVEKPDRDKKEAELLDKLFGNMSFKALSNQSPEFRAECDVLHQMEEDNMKRHDEVLIELLKIRRSLWT